jgi:hypothetical protein
MLIPGLDRSSAIMRPLTILSGCILPLAFLIGCRKGTAQEHMAPMPGDLKVEQTQGDLTKDTKPIHGDLKGERTDGGPKKDDESIPSDFQIFARYGAGFSDWKSWEFTITADGKVAQEIYHPAEKKTTTLSRNDLLDLSTKFDEVEFDTLPEKKSYRVTDNPTLIVAITRNKKTHRVSVYAPRHLKDDEEVKRFLRVWAELLRKVPSPNPADKPERWEP